MTAITTTQPAAQVIDAGVEPLPFDVLAPRFLATRNSDKTTSAYRRALSLYRACCAERDLDPLRLDGVIVFSHQQNAQRGNVADGTIRLRLKAVQSFFAWCYMLGETAIKPALVAASLTMPPARKLSPRDVLTVAEVKRLLAAARSQRDRLLLRVMVDAGLRVSEAIGLAVGDVYTAGDRCYLHVAHGKGDKERDPEIPPDLYAELRRYAGAWRADRRLFAIDRGNVWRMVATVAERAGVDRAVTPHTLRHTHAHHMRLADMPLEVLSERLGHASIETTKIYTRPAEMARAVPLPAMPWQATQ